MNASSVPSAIIINSESSTSSGQQSQSQAQSLKKSKTVRSLTPNENANLLLPLITNGQAMPNPGTEEQSVEQRQLVKENSFVELSELFKHEQRRRLTLENVKNARLEAKEELNTAFSRFYYHTPRYVESKRMFQEIRRKEMISERNICRGRLASQKQDARYDALLKGLADLKLLDKPKNFSLSF